MKLYATVTGLKNGQYVEKGQGSNQSLAIEILAEELRGIPTRANIYRLSLNIGSNNELEAELLDYQTGSVRKLTGCGDCQRAGWVACCNLNEPWHKKGEKKKGESAIEELDREAETLREIDSMNK